HGGRATRGVSPRAQRNPPHFHGLCRRPARPTQNESMTMNSDNQSSSPADSSCGCATERSAPAAAVRISDLRAALASAPELPLTVIWTDGEPIEAHFHVTEVGRVQRDFVDCGGTVRRV